MAAYCPRLSPGLKKIRQSTCYDCHATTAWDDLRYAGYDLDGAFWICQECKIKWGRA